MSVDEHTKDRARDLLISLAADRREAIDSQGLRNAISEELVAAVFDLAWDYQWNRDTAAFKRSVKPLIDAAVAEAVGFNED